VAQGRLTMRYVLLIYANEREWESKSPAEQRAILDEHGTLDADLVRGGKWKTSDALQPTRTATTVRVRDGKTLVSDGPYAETKEQLAGFYVVEARDLDDAIAIASRIPPARWGAVEVRPIWEMS
jgi:hypothetical protein